MGPRDPMDAHARLMRRANELYHDLQAEEFNEVHRDRHRVERRFWESEVVPRLKAMGFRSGLDLCTGTGFVPSILLPGVGQSSTIVCVDLSENALRRARSSLGPLAAQVEMRAGDVQSLPLPESSVDWVSLNAGLHHLPEPEAALREIDRVLKPGGYFCLGYEPNTSFFDARLLVLFERFVWHLFWYASPKQNVRRLRSWPGRPAVPLEAGEHLSQVNEALLGEHLIEHPLTLDELRRLVDAHTHEEEARPAGFRPDVLIGRCLAHYTVEVLLFSDYGGEMLRKCPRLRALVDKCLGTLMPGRGRLFSWVLRKPVRAVEHEAERHVEG